MTHEPLISIVTPCLNAAAVIRDAVESVAAQTYGHFEHIVLDGGSTDGTREILGEYEHVVRILEPDQGQYDAINRGFNEIAKGEVLAWLNADDLYLPHTLAVVAEIFMQFPQVQWLTTAYPLFADAAGRVVASQYTPSYSRRRALRPDSMRLKRDVPTAMQQESTFWRRSLWQKAGARTDTDYRYAADLELWLRFWEYAEVFVVNTPLGCFRWTDTQRSNIYEDGFMDDVEKIIALHGGCRAGLLRTVARRCALLGRGLPQPVLRNCGFAVTQPTLFYNRDLQRWELGERAAVLT